MAIVCPSGDQTVDPNSHVPRERLCASSRLSLPSAFTTYSSEVPGLRGGGLGTLRLRTSRVKLVKASRDVTGSAPALASAASPGDALSDSAPRPTIATT